jgi:hypothetical protein
MRLGRAASTGTSCDGLYRAEVDPERRRRLKLPLMLLPHQVLEPIVPGLLSAVA